MLGRLSDVDRVERLQWLRRLPERIETVSILNDLAFKSVVTVLMMLWTFGLWCRSQTVRRRVAARVRVLERARLPGERHVWGTFRWDAASAVANYLLAKDGWIKSCFLLLVACWAALCETSLDAVGILLAFAFISRGVMAVGIGISVAHASWAVVLMKAPWRNNTNDLTDFAHFLHDLPPADRTCRQGHTAEENEECMLCLSSDDCPLQMPCRRQHLICLDCLIRLNATERTSCPFCRTPLYTIEDSKLASYELCIVLLDMSFVFDMIIIALACYREAYMSAAIKTLASVLLWEKLWRTFQISRTGDVGEGGYLARWQSNHLRWGAMSLMAFAFYLAYRVAKMDEATFVDGKLVRGFEVKNGYSFYWDREVIPVEWMR